MSCSFNAYLLRIELKDFKPAIYRKASGSSLAFCLSPGGKLPAPTRPNHQPLRRQHRPHTEQPHFLSLVFALGGHAASATTGNSSPLLTCSISTLMLSCAGSNALAELRRSWCGSLRLRSVILVSRRTCLSLWQRQGMAMSPQARPSRWQRSCLKAHEGEIKSVSHT